MKNIALPTAGLLVIRQNKLLLAYSKNKKAWYLPGGKIDQGESAIEALIREIEEELGITLDTNGLQYYCHISAPAYGEHTTIIMEQECFLYDLQEKIHPSNEIEDVKFFSLEQYKMENIQVVGVLQAFDNLYTDGLLK